MSTKTRRTVAESLPVLFPELLPRLGDDAPLNLPPVSADAEHQIRNRLHAPDFDAWSEALSRVGNCARPIRLHGTSQTVDAGTGEVLSSYSSSTEPLGLTYVRCGNRRATECPSCSRLYAADTFHLIRAGVAGGKTVPVTVAENPLVFATLTAPSFGRVHGRRDGGSRCHPSPRGAPLCRHGRPRSCQHRHGDANAELGQPLCRDCYDYPSHVVWQWWAPDLWRRFTIALRRLVAKVLDVPASRLAEVATVQYAKVAEYQARGVVHFHALVRLDGPKSTDGFAPAPAGLSAETLAVLVREAATSVRLTVPAVDDRDCARVLVFGRQLDVRPVRSSRRTDDPDRSLQPEQVAGYLAKYATKSASDGGVADSSHHRRLRATVRELAVRAVQAGKGWDEDQPFQRLGKWVHMLGFRGHFATKSRRYSITLGALRRARRRAQALIAEHRADGRPLDLAALESDLLRDEEDQTTLVVGHWSYAGTGWATEGERLLAVAAAARAREYDRSRAEQRKQRTSRHRGEGEQGDG